MATPWALAPFLLLTPGLAVDDLFLVFVVAGLSAGAVGSLGAVPAVSGSYVVAMVAPLTAHLIGAGGRLGTIIAVMLIV